ncbi:MAG: magnesium and cobalt transport protein CorA, partial [Lacunisphaera sp.]|nr:magnesium and cobalt transport protein CorA [Lacunisphaera sp.]
TALTAVTLPAVLVGGWYGMNFENIPELHSPNGYYYACIFTLVVTALMTIYLKKKKWF